MVNNLKFCILIDNTNDKDLLAEHGFSVWIECDGKTILFDTGQNTDDSGILFKNAKALGCDLTTVDTLFLIRFNEIVWWLNLVSNHMHSSGIYSKVILLCDMP